MQGGVKFFSYDSRKSIFLVAGTGLTLNAACLFAIMAGTAGLALVHLGHRNLLVFFIRDIQRVVTVGTLLPHTDMSVVAESCIPGIIHFKYYITASNSSDAVHGSQSDNR